MGTALITGATAGLGRGFADDLASQGHSLIIVARDSARLASTAEQLFRLYGVDVEVLAADLSDPVARGLVETRLADADRPVDILVNNAGYGLKEPFRDSDIDAEQAMLDVLVTAPLRLTHAALPGMLARQQGAIINVSSVAGWISAGTYSAAKAWVITFTEGLAADLQDTGVTATVVCPGFVHTEYHDRSGISKPNIPGFMWLNVEQVVATALKDAKQGRVVSVPSHQYQILSALAQYAPRPIVRRVSTLRKR